MKGDTYKSKWLLKARLCLREPVIRALTIKAPSWLPCTVLGIFFYLFTLSFSGIELRTQNAASQKAGKASKLNYELGINALAVGKISRAKKYFNEAIAQGQADDADKARLELIRLLVNKPKTAKDSEKQRNGQQQSNAQAEKQGRDDQKNDVKKTAKDEQENDNSLEEIHKNAKSLHFTTDCACSRGWQR